MSALRRLLPSPLEVIGLLVVVVAAGLAALRHAQVREVARTRDEAIGVLLAVRKGQDDMMATRGRFAKSLDELRGALAGQNATTTSKTMARTAAYTYVLADGLGDKAWRMTAIGNLDADPWPDILVVQGSEGGSGSPVISSDDTTHRVCPVVQAE